MLCYVTLYTLTSLGQSLAFPTVHANGEVFPDLSTVMHSWKRLSHFIRVLQSAEDTAQCSFVGNYIFPCLFVLLSTSFHFLFFYESYY